MFEQLVVSSATRKRRRTWLYFSATALVWVSVLSAALAVGVLAYDAKITEPDEAALKIPVIPIKLGGGTRPVERRPPSQRPPGFVAPRFPTPLTQNANPQPPVLAPLPVGSATGPAGPGTGGPGLGGPGDPLGVQGGGESTDAPRPVEPTRERNSEVRNDDVAKRPSIIRSIIIQGNATRKVEPQYPTIARSLHIGGSVIVEVVIGEQGDVISARALSGHPVLKQCAVEAARGWKWNPTRLNGVAVQVIGTITFNFNLN